MSDRTAASAGVVLAGVALAGALAPWPAGRPRVAAVAAAAGLAAFLLRRHGRLGRSPGAALAGLGSLAALGLGLGAIVGPSLDGGTGRLAAGPGVTVAAGLGGALAALADYRGTSRARLVAMVAATANGLAVGVAGLVAVIGWLAVATLLVSAVLPGGEPSASVRTGVGAVAGGLGTATAAWVYLEATDEGLSYLDLRRPDRRELGYAAGGAFLILGLNLAVERLFEWIGLESATHGTLRAARADPQILLVLIPLSYLVIGPGEELLYRNVVQKSLYDAFSRRGAIVVASAVFALAHVFSYFAPAAPLKTLNGLVVVFVLSTVLGVVYDRTRNLAVPALAHGTFDAVVFGLAYVQFTGV